MGYLKIQEVAKILQVHTNTVYKMCRQGVLPAVKIGKEWRINHDGLTQFMEKGINRSPGRNSQGLTFPVLGSGHILGLFSDQQEILDFERAFFLSAPRKGYRFLKACWWQDPEEVKRDFMRSGMPLEEMEARSDLIFLDLNGIYERYGPVGAADAWFKEVTLAMEQGYKGVYGSGSPTFTCCDTHEGLLEFENALHHKLKGLPVTAICSYFLPHGCFQGLPKLVDLIELHDRLFIRTPHKQLLVQPISS